MRTTYLPKGRSASVSGVRPLHTPLTVTAARAGVELTTMRPLVSAAGFAGSTRGFSRTVGVAADFVGAAFVAGGFAAGGGASAALGGVAPAVGATVRASLGEDSVGLDGAGPLDAGGVSTRVVGVDAGVDGGAAFATWPSTLLGAVCAVSASCLAESRVPLSLIHI